MRKLHVIYEDGFVERFCSGDELYVPNNHNPTTTTILSIGMDNDLIEGDFEFHVYLSCLGNDQFRVQYAYDFDQLTDRESLGSVFQDLSQHILAKQ
jgi:hypothetical protein